MNKITIKTNHSQLNVIISIMNEVLAFNTTDVSLKFNQSIINELNVRFSKKNIDKAATEKPFKLSIKYYEAFILQMVLDSFYETCSNIYDRNVCLIIKNQIHEQL